MLKMTIKDQSGSIDVSLWGKLADAHAELPPKTSIKICQGERSTYESEATINTWEDSTTIEVYDF